MFHSFFIFLNFCRCWKYFLFQYIEENNIYNLINIFSDDEERQLEEHISYMANIGYGYNKMGMQQMAREYADSLGKSVKSERSLSNYDPPEVIACGFVSLLHTIFGGECSVVTPVSSTLKICSGLSCRLYFVRIVESSL
jgi:hypothetical protein